MAINIDYTPIGTGVALGGIAGAGAGQVTAQQLAQRKQQQDMELLRQAQADLLQRQQFQQSVKQNTIGTALAYDRLNQDKAQTDAALAQRQSEESANNVFRKDQLAQQGQQFNTSDQRLQQGNDLQQQKFKYEQDNQATKDKDVSALIDRAYPIGTADVENAKARLVYKATGKLPEEVLVPRTASGVANASLDFQRTIGTLNKTIQGAFDQFGNVKPGFDLANIAKVIAQRDALLQQGSLDAKPADAPAAQPAANAAPAPAISSQQATQIIQNFPKPPAPNAPIDANNVAQFIQGVATILGRPPSDPMVIQKAKESAAHSGWSIPQ